MNKNTMRIKNSTYQQLDSFYKAVADYMKNNPNPINANGIYRPRIEVIEDEVCALNSMKEKK